MSQSPLFREASGGIAEVPNPRGTVSVGALAWLLVGAIFVALRIGTAFEAPVGGAELVHLSGAWQARMGADDARYIPTLFQAWASFPRSLAA